jgi:type I restriction enzyme S subunit
MDVRPGYKQTEVGVIPEDWEVKSINQIGTPVRGGSPRPAGDPRYFNGSYIPWLTVAALTNIPLSQPVVSETETCLTEEGSLYSRTLTPGTLIIANSGATLGIAKILGVKCCANDGIAALLNFSKSASSSYAAHFINTKTSYLREVVATGNGQPNLNTELIGDFKIPLPPTKAEQEAIAEALTDADALIESLEQLLSKKRQLKQGAMQELLSPASTWSETTLLNLANGKKELFDDGDWIESEHITSEGVRLVQTGNIGVGQFLDKDAKKYIFESSFVSLRCKEILEGDLLICRLADPAGRACILPNITEEKIVASVDVTIFRPPVTLANRVFLANLFSTDEWFRAVSDRSGGTTHKRISRGALGRMKILLPALEEQTAIATILSDMDADISALEAKLTKARAIKQGMMQELLTGKIRLIEREPLSAERGV